MRCIQKSSPICNGTNGDAGALLFGTRVEVVSMVCCLGRSFLTGSDVADGICKVDVLRCTGTGEVKELVGCDGLADVAAEEAAALSRSIILCNHRGRLLESESIHLSCG